MTKRMLRPMGDRVVVVRNEVTEKSPGGLFIPVNSQEKSLEARVVAVGPGKPTSDGWTEVAVNIGDNVLVGKFAGTEINIDGTEYLILREDDIIGVFENTGE